MKGGAGGGGAELYAGMCMAFPQLTMLGPGVPFHNPGGVLRGSWSLDNPAAAGSMREFCTLQLEQCYA